MDIVSLCTTCRFRLLTKGRISTRICQHRGSHLFVLALAILVVATGCATPRVQPADPQLLFKSELLAFIQDGVTTREEVFLKLGMPSAQFEGEKILTYQLRVDKDGTWHLTAPQVTATTGFRQWLPGTCSLVLVFGSNGVLRKHSLVEAQ
jgi:hypothetical protein